MASEHSRHVPCIIPCGGSSTRLGTGENKCLTGNVPPLAYVVDFWRKHGIEDFIFIVGGRHERETVNTIEDICPQGVTLSRGNIVNLAQALTIAESWVKGRFVLALGDCLNFGDFITSWDTDFGISVCIADVEELRKNFLVGLNSHSIARLVEKPKDEVGLCGMGTYFLHRRFFDYVRRLRLPAEATSVDLTGALQLAIGSGEEMTPVYFKGTYINVTYPQDVKRAEEIYNVSSSRP